MTKRDEIVSSAISATIEALADTHDIIGQELKRRVLNDADKAAGVAKVLGLPSLLDGQYTSPGSPGKIVFIDGGQVSGIEKDGKYHAVHGAPLEVVSLLQLSVHAEGTQHRLTTVEDGDYTGTTKAEGAYLKVVGGRVIVASIAGSRLEPVSEGKQETFKQSIYSGLKLGYLNPPTQAERGSSPADVHAFGYLITPGANHPRTIEDDHNHDVQVFRTTIADGAYLNEHLPSTWLKMKSGKLVQAMIAGTLVPVEHLASLENASLRIATLTPISLFRDDLDWEVPLLPTLEKKDAAPRLGCGCNDGSCGVELLADGRYANTSYPDQSIVIKDGLPVAYSEDGMSTFIPPHARNHYLSFIEEGQKKNRVTFTPPDDTNPN